MICEFYESYVCTKGGYADACGGDPDKCTLERCPVCASAVGHFINCPRGIATATKAHGCRHAVSNYQVNPDDGSVWCFVCKPPRQITP